MAVARAHHHSTARFITVSARYKEFLEDLLANFGPVSIRNLFSGAGVSAEGVMFAIVVNDTFYPKADAVSARDFTAEGKTPFASRRKGRGRSPCPIGRCRTAFLRTPRSLPCGRDGRTPLPLPLPPRPSQNSGVRDRHATESGCFSDNR